LDIFGLMADTLESAAPTRRRRSDARRSIDAIIGAARTVLGERPDASMADPHRRTSRGRAPHHRCGSDHAPEEHTATVRCRRA